MGFEVDDIVVVVNSDGEEGEAMVRDVADETAGEYELWREPSGQVRTVHWFWEREGFDVTPDETVYEVRYIYDDDEKGRHLGDKTFGFPESRVEERDG